MRKMLCIVMAVAVAMFCFACSGNSSKPTEPTGPNPPTVTTTAVSAVTQSTIQCGGNITSDGGASVTVRGVCWSTSSSPTTSDSKTSDGSGTGNFVSTINNLTPGTTYYVRAYATNSVGTGYGSALPFTTTSSTTNLPTVTTAAVSAITQTSATCGGTVTSDGGAFVTARGVCWSTDSLPTIADSRTYEGTGTGNFTSSITGLTDSMTYMVRAYATNSLGTGYGSVQYITAPTPPTVYTAEVYAVTSKSAFCGGNVTSDGGSAVTARGVCWSTDSLPTIADNTTVNGSGIGSFASSMTALVENTVYYVRAYATNVAGTSYGDMERFKTIDSVSAMVDRDGNVYYTVKIGQQWWMAENLRTTHYRNGDSIPKVADPNSWQTRTTGGYCIYNNNANNEATYGPLYNWYAVNDSRNIAPEGWHVPTQAELQTLVDYLGGWQVAGGKLKEAGTTHWGPNNVGATNESGFFALGGGYRDYYGFYKELRYMAFFWVSTPYDSDNARCFTLHTLLTEVDMTLHRMKYGLSIRCVKD